MICQVFEGNAYPAPWGSIRRSFTIRLGKFMRVLLGFDVVEDPSVLLKGSDLDTEDPLGVPSGVGNEPNDCSGSHNPTASHTNIVLVRAKGSSQEYPVPPRPIQFAPEVLRDEPKDLLPEFCQPFMGLVIRDVYTWQASHRHVAGIY